jgi:CheY-like chemotaxis protein
MNTNHSTASVIVVAEDEPLLRMLAVEFLNEEGFETVEAETATSALDLCEGRPHGIAALFTDIKMPGSMDGLQLARTVHQRWPWIVVLVASGNSPSPKELPEGARFLPKPYDMNRVTGIIRASILN